MKTITIKITVNDREWELLKLGKCEAPEPQLVKMILLSRAASNLRNLTEQVMRSARVPTQQRAISTLLEHKAHKPKTDTEKAIERADKRIEETPQHARTRAAVRLDKERQMPVLNRKPGRIPLDGDKRTPMKTDASAQPDWLDDDNIDKLRN